MHNKKLYGTTTVGTKGQLVIPILAREELGINTGDKLYVLGSPKQGIAVLMQEEKMEDFITQIDLHLETIKTFKKSVSKI